PPIVDAIDEVNQFRAGKMNLVLMDTNELALVDLVKEIYKFEKNEITAIVYIEEDFSRVIFLRGSHIHHITPIIHKGSMSKDVLEVIYSRIIFAQDQYFIPELNKVLVAGHSSKLKAKYYFRQKFPSAVTGYLNSKKIQSRLKFKDRGLLFSRYAIPIALAWKALQKHVVSSKTNFLPEYLLERQRMPKLAPHGYLLMFLLAITAFSFTWLLVAKNLDIREVTRQTNRIKTQLENNKSLAERVKTFDNQIIDIEKRIALVDSFSQGYNETTKFLDLLNQAVRKTGGIWITHLSKKNDLVQIRGLARRRDRIPTLANSLGGANLKKVTRAEYQNARVFDFRLEKRVDALGEEEPSKNLNFFSLLTGNNGTSEKASRDNASSRNGVSPRGNTQSRNKAESTSTSNKTAAKQTSESKNSHSEKAELDAIDYRYGLQIGTFDSKTEAHKASKKYSDRGYPVMISRTGSPGKNKYSVIVGAYENKGQAQKLSKLFASRSRIENKVVRFKNTTTN
ncbi:hypothetical protein GWN42_32930, partial [candidate division KSB1 bacterium]|nr:hypothetical protein [candidate division KSB1 bacterium]